MQHAMYNAEHGQGHATRALLENLHEEGEHVETEMSVRIVEIFYHAFRPLETLFAERAAAVQCHYRTEILQFLAFLRTHLENQEN